VQHTLDPANQSANRSNDAGLTVIELLIVLMMVLIVASIASVTYANALMKARVTRAVADIRIIEKELLQHSMEETLPETLDALGLENTTDPWGNGYRYLRIAGANGKGQLRKDRFLVPLNSDYDLYSMGADGDSKPPLTARASHDDILRAGDGAFVGLASEF
jgi:general secretion pathway protein G